MTTIDDTPQVYPWAHNDDARLRNFIFERCLQEVDEVDVEKFIKFMQGCYNWIKSAPRSTH